MVSKLSPSKSHRKLLQKWSVALKIMPLVILIAVLKFTSHSFGLEIMELNALFTSLVAGTIFLIGFLIRDLDNPLTIRTKVKPEPKFP